MKKNGLCLVWDLMIGEGVFDTERCPALLISAFRADAVFHFFTRFLVHLSVVFPFRPFVPSPLRPFVLSPVIEDLHQRFLLFSNLRGVLWFFQSR
jgi:hypothetical protein